jgi:hypothetical protein
VSLDSGSFSLGKGKAENRSHPLPPIRRTVPTLHADNPGCIEEMSGEKTHKNAINGRTKKGNEM